MRYKHLGILACLMLSTALVGCQKEEPAAAARPPAEVGIVKLHAEALPINNELPGRIAPTRLAEVRPRVTGIVVDQVFQQGSLVNKGDVLYRIDAEPFKVQVSSAEATLKRAEAAFLQAQQSADRIAQLRKTNVSSQRDNETAIATLAQAQADVAVARAGLDEAKLNLQYTDVTAPISGHIGRALITEGALVSANGAENLATIQQLDPIYADFTQPAADLIRLRKALQDGQLMTGPNETTVHLILDDGTRYPLDGRLLFSEAAVDESTGQVTLRGEFPNPNRDLLPGMYVRVEIEQGIQRAAFAVPTQAVQRDSSGQANVLVVNDEDVVEQRRVVVGRMVGQRWVVESGLKEGDRVIAEGFQKTAAGAKVKPVEWNAAEKTAAVE
ncbi:efflux RND transporter periplasmic adaptor subunit [Brucellaceae bacterium C25G]